MATQNKKDTVAGLQANIFDNATKQITPTRNKVPFNSIINSVSFNILIAQLQQEDDSAEPSLVNILDAGKQGVFAYDPADISTADDGVTCIITLTGKRYKRRIPTKFDARWTGLLTPYFATVAAANAAIPATARFMGLEVDILLAGGVLSTYWYRDGTGDANLVIKNTDIQIIDFTVGDGLPNTPANGANTLTDPRLVGRTIIAFIYANNLLKVLISPATQLGTDTYAQFDGVAGSLKQLPAGSVYSTGSHGLIIYK